MLFIVHATNDAPPPCQAVWREDETSGGGGGGGVDHKGMLMS